MHDAVAVRDHRLDRRFVAKVTIDDFLVRRSLPQIIDIAEAQDVRQMGQTLARHLAKSARRASDQKSFHMRASFAKTVSARPYPPPTPGTARFRHGS